jgi:hypothetical protein
VSEREGVSGGLNVVAFDVVPVGPETSSTGGGRIVERGGSRGGSDLFARIGDDLRGGKGGTEVSTCCGTAMFGPESIWQSYQANECG